jgi:hypothetical protein
MVTFTILAGVLATTVAAGSTSGPWDPVSSSIHRMTLAVGDPARDAADVPDFKKFVHNATTVRVIFLGFVRKRRVRVPALSCVY